MRTSWAGRSMPASMKTDYSKHPETGVWALEEGLAAIGRLDDAPKLIQEIEQLTETEVLRLFNGWPDLAKPEGVWGSMVVGGFTIMAQLDTPPKHRRELGAPLRLKIDRAGTRDEIRRRLEELG
jgi:hypothetical protein